MSGGPGRGPGRGPGGYGYPYRGDNGTPGASAASSSSRGSGGNLPVWALVLIMVGSGLVTLTFLWLCVLFVCRKRRARRAAVRDLEAAQAASQRETALMLPGGPGSGDLKSDEAKRCEASEAGVELTFVVMAGEDQPSYLAKPAPKAADPLSPPAKDAAAATAPPAPFEKSVEKERDHGSETVDRSVVGVEKSTTPSSPS